VNTAAIIAMNARIATRRDALADAFTVPVAGPSWSERVVDTGTEVIAVHAITGESFPIDPRRDLDANGQAIVIARRILRAGGSVAEVKRYLDAALDPAAAGRLKSKLDAEVAT
jgi:hypothetical protein